MTIGRTSAEAVANYLHSIQRTVSCVTASVVDVSGGYHPSPVPHRLAMNGGVPVGLGGPSRLMFRLQQHYCIEEPEGPGSRWRVEVVEYYYSVHDAEEREVLLYHWHPRGSSSGMSPHLHLGHGAQVGRRDIREAHLPTGDVSLSAVIRVLIEEMGVRPLRSDWDSILTE